MKRATGTLWASLIGQSLSIDLQYPERAAVTMRLTGTVVIKMMPLLTLLLCPYQSSKHRHMKEKSNYSEENPTHGVFMMTSSNTNICRVTSPPWGGLTGHRWIPLKRPVTRSFELCLNERLSKHLRHRWFETPSHSLWRHCNVCNDPWRVLHSHCTSPP